jgi:hypothetical protein
LAENYLKILSKYRPSIIGNFIFKKKRKIGTRSVLSNTTPPFCPGEISLDKVAWHGAAYVMPWELPQFYMFPRSHGFFFFFSLPNKKEAKKYKKRVVYLRKGSDTCAFS